MKSIFFTALFIFSFSEFSYARLVPVKTSNETVFGCAYGKKLAQADLSKQCDAIDMVLKNYAVTSCVRTGEDGGYYEYYALKASGICEDKE
jgi:hypothetical protein